MGTRCSKEDWTLEEAESNRIRRAEKPFTHPVVKLLIGKKVVKRRPVISYPKPVNPVYLRGRKWRHVIITVPKIEEPPVRPARRRKAAESTAYSRPTAGAASVVATEQNLSTPRSSLDDARPTSYVKLLSGLCALQLCRYLRLAKTAIFITCERNSSLVCRRDLYRIFRQRGANESVTKKSEAANAVPPMPPRNTSLTNEPSDTYLRRYDDANTNGFKNFSLLTAAERDLDKLKLWKVCRPLQLCRALPLASTINDANESGSAAARFLDELTHRAEDVANNTTTKTNQNRNTANSRKSNIKKVWRRMKKNGGKLIATKTSWRRAAKEHSLRSPLPEQQVVHCQQESRPALVTCPNGDDYCSITDPLCYFSATL